MLSKRQKDEEFGKPVSYDVDERMLRREHEMEATRMRSIELQYRLWYGSGTGLELSHALDDLQAAGDCIVLVDFESTLAEVSDEIWSEDVNLQLHATIRIEKLLSTERECPATIVKNRVVQRFFSFLTRDAFLELQYEAAWVLIKIFCGISGRIKAEIVHETVPWLVRLIDSPRDDVCEMAVFSLGVVADDCRKYRDLVLSNGVLVPLLKQLEKNANLGKHVKLSMLRNLTWALSTLCEDISESSYKQLKLALPTLERLLHFDDMEVLINSCWAIFGLSCDKYGKIDLLMDAGLCPKLVELISHTSCWVQIPVLLIVGLITFHQAHIQTLIENGVLGPLGTLLTEDRKDQDPKDGDKLIKSQVCRVISGIVDGNERQLQDVIEANFFDHLVKLLESPHERLQLKAAGAIATATSRGSPKQIEYLVSVCKIINPICNLLSCPNPKKVDVVLQVLEKVLEAGNKGSSSINPYIELIVETGCVEKIKKIWMREIECGPDGYDSAPYVLWLLGLNDGLGRTPSDFDLSQI